ncbi:MAG: FecR domain-containing protein [Pseudomonadota bacterium]
MTQSERSPPIGSRTLLSGLLIVLASCDRCQPAPAGVLQEVSPLVQVSHGSATAFAAGNGTEVRPGDTVSSDEQGSATLRFPDGSSVTLGPSSSLVVEAGPEGMLARQVRLLFGTIEAEGTAAGLVVMTSLGPIQFGADPSRIAVTSGDDGLSVRTLLGQVQLGQNTITQGITVRLDKSGIVFGEPVDAGTADAGTTPDLGETSPIVVTLKAGRGVYRQAGGQGRFRVASAGDALEVGDVVEARSGQATLGLGDAGEARVDRRSQLEVGAGGASFMLRRGGSQVLLVANQRQVVALGGVQATIIASGHGADVEVSGDARGGRIRVVEGRASVRAADGSTAEVLANQEALIDRNGAASVRAVGRSALQINTGVRRVYAAGSLPALTFVWSELEGQGPYTIEIAKDPEFKNLITVATVPDTTYTTDRLGFGGYHWRVRNAQQSAPAQRLILARDQDASGGDARKNIVRASGERTVVVYQQWQTPQLTFRWTERPGTPQYRVAIYADGSFDKPLVEQVTTEAKLRLAPGTLKDGKYVWAYSALDAAGKNLSTSDMYDLEVKFDSNDMLLRILTPRPNARISGGSIETRGMVAPGSNVSANGKNLSPDKAGRFSDKVPVPRDSPFLIFKVGSNLFVRRLKR